MTCFAKVLKYSMVVFGVRKMLHQVASDELTEDGPERQMDGVATDVVRDLYLGKSDVSVHITAEVPERVATCGTTADIYAQTFV